MGPVPAFSYTYCIYSSSFSPPLMRDLGIGLTGCSCSLRLLDGNVSSGAQDANKHITYGGIHMNALTQAEVDARTAGVEYFSPEGYLINELRRATANKQDLLIELDGVGEIILLSSRGEYFGFATDMAEFCTVPLDRYKITILEPGHLRMPSMESVGRNIDELMWQTAFYASSGRLMEGCYRDDVVELAFWPNLTRLPMTENTPRIAALLNRHPTSITFAARLLKVDMPEMFQFYSAARSAGFARAINRTPEEPKLEPHRNQSLLSALLSKVARL
jgi:hypothetical protein